MLRYKAKLFHNLVKPFLSSSNRTLVSKNGQWIDSLNYDVKKKIDAQWKEKVAQKDAADAHDASSAITKGGSKVKYVLSMFPYPSGKLHMGHVRVYAISDTLTRYYRMRGQKVFHPMGFDSFGLPAENAARVHGVSPKSWTDQNIDNMEKQLREFNFSFDWRSKIVTSDESYYKWTQYLFLKLYENGLVYQKEAFVNWDPVDKTVLANEQVDENGKSWRSGATVEKKLMKQWFVRTSYYAEKLRKGLDDMKSSLGKEIVELQRNWIGKCDGRRIKFKIETPNREHLELEIFTKQPHGLYGVSFLAIKPDSVLLKQLERSSYGLQQTEASSGRGQKLSVSAINPLTNVKIPIFVLGEKSEIFNHDETAHIGIPSLDQDDMLFAEEEDLEVVDILDGKDYLTKSEEFSGLSVSDAFDAVGQHCESKGFASPITSGRLEDWCISRQRKWGTPIPMIHCEKCGTMPIEYENLPRVVNDGDVAESKCGNCDGKLRLDGDTMDTFVDSSWYFLRYLDPNNSIQPYAKDKADAIMPVDLYIGGKEHAIMHLFYARFMSYFLHDLGWLSTAEPFKKLLVQGFVQGETFKNANTNQYLKRDDVECINESEKVYQVSSTKEPVTVSWEKMSKSLFNGVDPSEVISQYGVDSSRLYMLDHTGPRSHRKWDPEQFQGSFGFENRLWLTVGDFYKAKSKEAELVDIDPEVLNKTEKDIFDSRNYYIKGVNFQLQHYHALSTAVGRMQGLLSSLRRVPFDIAIQSQEYERALASLISMIYPFCPHYAAELWTTLARVSDYANGEIWNQKWPQIDCEYLMPVQVFLGGHELDQVRIPLRKFRSLNHEEAINIAFTHSDLLKQYLPNKTFGSSKFEHVENYEARVHFMELEAAKKFRAHVKQQKAEKKKAKLASAAGS